MYEQQMKDISVDDLKNRIRQKDKAMMLLDTRVITSYYKGHIPGSCSLFDGEAMSRAKDLDKNLTIVAYGPGQAQRSENPEDRQAGDVLMKLRNLGFKNLMELKGGFEAWANAGNRVDSSPPGSIKPAQPGFMMSTESGVRDL